MRDMNGIMSEKISAPPMTMTSGLISSSRSSSSTEWITCTPSAVQAGSRVSTMFCLPGSGLPMLSYVFRPISTGCPVVMRLKVLRSSGSRQGNTPR